MRPSSTPGRPYADRSDAPVPPPQARPGGLARLGAASARHPVLVVLLWLAALVLAGAGRQLLGGSFSDAVDLPGTQSGTGAALLAAHEPAAGGASGLVVFHVPSATLGTERAAIERSVTALGRLGHVLSVSDPFTTTPPTLSADGRTGYATVQFDARPKTLGQGYLAQLDGAVTAARGAGVQVEYGGGLAELTRPAPNDRTSELVGFAVALIVLLVGFGSVLAAVLPLVTAVFGVLIGIGILGMVAA